MSTIESDIPDRLIELNGTSNTRDAGGYRTPHGSVARGRLFRSDGLHELDDSARARLADLGVRTIIDFRHDTERAEQPSALAGLDVAVFEHPIGDGRQPDRLDELAHQTLDDAYRSMVSEAGPVFAEAIAHLAEPGALPAVVHCTAGKDRTGIAIAFVLELLGVDDADIAADYERSERLLDQRFRERMSEAWATFDEDAIAIVEEFLRSPAELIAATLAEVRGRHGSVESYLCHHGLSEEAIGSLRTALIENTADV